ncbi:hypothetical protein ACP7H9_00090 [Idiomarina sp. ST20R2A10]|uniref:hypothetical protein n=1 Tax=Idiomarina sp. ST20R2A10 TaxID=3418369 RepID=UPI003EC55181
MKKGHRNRVVFHSVHDISGGHSLSLAEKILDQHCDEDDYGYNINDIVELYNIKLFFDNGLYLKSWSESDKEKYIDKVKGLSSTIGRFFSQLDDAKFVEQYNQLSYQYLDYFWCLVNNYQAFKNISSSNFKEILKVNPNHIRNVLRQKFIVKKYKNEICELLKSYDRSAEILLSIYEVDGEPNSYKLYLPDCLTNDDKERIVSNYIASEHCGTGYLKLIQNSKRHSDFVISDKVRLEAKRKYQLEVDKIFNGTSRGVMKFGVSIRYREKAEEKVSVSLEGSRVNYEYSLDYIRKNNELYSLYRNFKILFDYVDNQNRITLVSKQSQLGVLERFMGVRSRSEYIYGMAFTQLDMASSAQIFSYAKVLLDLDQSLESILQYVFNKLFSERYGFPSNSFLTVPTASASALEKVRTIAPELESILKQYKLFVENGYIDFELLQITSGPTLICNIPSLNKNKYIYRNSGSIDRAMDLFCSDQTLLAYVEPFKDKQYKNFIELLLNESEILFSNYEKYQQDNLNYLIDNSYIFVDENDRVRVRSWERVIIIKDLFENEVSSLYRYPKELRREAIKMEEESLVYFESSLFSIPEQNYFNYFLNKREFTNGLDLRNSYLHGTQANPSETDLHENSYLIYLKLLTLILLKLEDDLAIYCEFDNICDDILGRTTF